MSKDIRLEVHVISILIFEIFKNNLSTSHGKERFTFFFTNKLVLNDIEAFTKTMNIRPIRDNSRKDIRTAVHVFMHGNSINIAHQVKVFGKALNHRLLLDFLAEHVILVGKTKRSKCRMVRITHLHELHLAITIEEVHVHRVKAFLGGKLLADILERTRLEHAILIDAAHKLVDIDRVRCRILDVSFERFAKRVRRRLIHGIRRNFFGFEIDVIHRCVFRRKRFDNGNIAFEFYFLFCNFFVQLNPFGTFLVHCGKRHNHKSRNAIAAFHDLHHKAYPRVLENRSLKEQFATVIVSKETLDILRACKAHPFFLVFAIDNLHHSASAIRTCIALLLVAKINIFRGQNFTGRIVRQVAKENRLILRHNLFVNKACANLVITVCKGDHHCRRLFIFIIDLHELHFAVADLPRNI